MFEIDTTIRRGIFDNTKRSLKINSQFIEFKEDDLIASPPTRFMKDDIAEFCFGSYPIRGIYFYVGRQFEFRIRDNNQKVIKISFKYYYGIRSKELRKLYLDIFNALWSFYFGVQAAQFIERFNAGKIVRIGEVGMTENGIHFEDKGLIIPWPLLGIKFYAEHFTIYSKNNSQTVSRSFYFIDNWNTAVLASVVEEILKLKDPIRIPG